MFWVLVSGDCGLYWYERYSKREIGVGIRLVALKVKKKKITLEHSSDEIAKKKTISHHDTKSPYLFMVTPILTTHPPAVPITSTASSPKVTPATARGLARANERIS